MSKFVVATEEVKISPELTVDKNDVGVIVEQNNDFSKIFFIRLWENVNLKNEFFKEFDENQTGDAYPKKICNVCHKLLDTSTFERNQNGVNNRPVRRPSCKSCRLIINGMSVKSKIRKDWVKKKPDHVPFECPICKKRTIAGITSKIVLDHNHLTGDPRAWVCDSCNTGIGRFKDDISILQRAIKFLE